MDDRQAGAAQRSLFIPGSIEDYIPDDHILKQVDGALDLSWLRDEVADTYCRDKGGCSIDPKAALRLMLAGLFYGTTHDRKLMREAQVNLKRLAKAFGAPFLRFLLLWRPSYNCLGRIVHLLRHLAPESPDSR